LRTRSDTVPKSYAKPREALANCASRVVQACTKGWIDQTSTDLADGADGLLRIALDGAPAEAVDTEAKELAAKQLARVEARNAAKKATAPAKPKPAVHTSRRHK
jgi:hypothetical protein